MMTTALIYMLTTLCPTKNGQPNEVDADKDHEPALMDRPEGNDMQKSKSDSSKIVARGGYLLHVFSRILRSRINILSYK